MHIFFKKYFFIMFFLFFYIFKLCIIMWYKWIQNTWGIKKIKYNEWNVLEVCCCCFYAVYNLFTFILLCFPRLHLLLEAKILLCKNVGKTIRCEDWFLCSWKIKRKQSRNIFCWNVKLHKHEINMSY